MYGRAATGIKLGLENMRAALALLGDPQKRMRHVVVAGTNGKGSTSTLIAEALRASGVRVGHYTSPHLLRFTERIRIAGGELSAERVAPYYERIAGIEPQLAQRLSFFEIATLMAFLAFAEDGVELAVLEVGLGGRLDAVNVVDKVLTVVTPIGLDHQLYLGNDLRQIAFEKAGIMQHGVPSVSAPLDYDAWEVLSEHARTIGSPLRVAPPLATSIPGSYQRVNAGVAAVALDMLGVDRSHFDAACASFAWPGRYQWLGDVLLDGAHNPHGVAALLEALEADDRARGRAMHLVATVLADKPPGAIISPLAAHARSVVLTTVGSKRTRSKAELAALGYPVAETMLEALRDARARAAADGGFVLVAGSLFLVADALAELTSAPRDPPIDG